MSKQQLAVASIAISIILAAGGGYMVGHSASRSSKNSPMENNPPQERKALYWYDPMMPNQHFDKPGKSPFMDMDLVAMYDDAQASPGSVSIDPRASQNTGIRTTQVTLGSLEQSLETVGNIQPDEHRIEVVQSRTSGWVEQLHVKAVNDPVKKGQLLLELYSPDLLAAQEEYLLALKSLHGQIEDKALRQAARQKLSLLGLTDEQVAALEKKGQPSRRIPIYAPSNGIVAELGVRQGAQISTGMNLFSLVDLSSIWVTAEIPENQGNWIRIGTMTEISIPAYPGKLYKGNVQYISPQISATSRTLQARIRLDNPRNLLKPGMFAQVTLLDSTQSRQPVPLVPNEALITTGKRSVVIVTDGEGKFHPIEVKTGRDARGYTEILAGLSEGQTIVISGQFLIDSESNMKTAFARFSEPEPAGMQNTPDTKTADDGKKTVQRVHSGSGIVKHVDMKNSMVNLAHEAIPSINWPAMTMDFSVKDPAIMKGIKPGDKIKFELTETTKGEFIITQITPAG